MPFSRPVLSLCLLVSLSGNATSQMGQYRGPGSLLSEENRSKANAPAPWIGVNRAPIPAVDLTQWQFWWEFNKDIYLPRRFPLGAPGVTGLPTTEIDARVVPFLQGVLRGSEQRNVVSAALIALARSGAAARDASLVDIIGQRLNSRDQQIRETAALALGITGQPRARRVLSDLLLDKPRGREVVDRETVTTRTRAFAAYGLGFIASANDDLQVQSLCLSDLQAIVDDPSVQSQDLKVAVIHGLGMLRIDGKAGQESERLLRTCLGVLERFYLRKGNAAHERVQAHVPKAIANLLGAGPEDQVSRYKELFLAELQGKLERRGHDIQRSVVLALGRLCGPHETEESPDAVYSQALLDYYGGRRADQQTRSFCLIALAQIGGVRNRAELLIALEGASVLDKPWAALALGVYAHEVYEAARAAGTVADMDRAMGDALHDHMKQSRNPAVLGALAIGLGLSRYIDAADDMRAFLAEHRDQDELAGYLAMGLALMNDRRSLEDIHNLIVPSRPGLVQHTALALGILQHPGSRTVLENVLETPMPLPRPRQDPSRGTYMLGSAARALGWIGTRRDLERSVQNDRVPDLNRAMAIAALGILASGESEPWNAGLAADMNYRAVVETLTDMLAMPGVLDLL